MSEDRQPVVDETQASAKPDAKVDSARNDGNDLDTLLAQYDKETTKPDPVSPPVQQQQTKPETTQSDPLVQRLYNRFEKEDLGNLVSQVKGDIDEDPDIVEAWIDARARKDHRLQRAWLERDQNPENFKRIAKELGREFAKRASKRVDPQVTEDVNAVAAAVRGASTNRAPETAPPNYSRMNHAEYRQSVIEQYGYDPG